MKKKKENEKRSYILTKETLGVTIMLFSALVFIMLLSYNAIFLGFGKAICTFMYGTFGYGSYLVVAALAYLGEWLVFEKSIKVKPRIAICLGVTVFCLFMLFHAVTTRNYEMVNYGGYLGQCYTNAANGYSGYTFGGVISGLLVYPVAKVMSYVGAYVIFSILSVLFGAMSFIVIRNVLLTKTVEKVGTETRKTEKDKAVDENTVREEDSLSADDRLYSVNENHEIVTNVNMSRQQPVVMPTEEVPQEDDDRYSRKNLGRQILFENGEFAAESYRRNMIYNDNSYFNHPVHNDSDYLHSFSDGSAPSASQQQSAASYTEDFSHEVESGVSGNSTPSYVYGDTPVSDLGGHVEKDKEDNGYSSYTVDNNSGHLNYEDVDKVDDNGVEEEKLDATFTDMEESAVQPEQTVVQPVQNTSQPQQTYRDPDQTFGQQTQTFEQPARFERRETPSEDTFRQPVRGTEDRIQPSDGGLNERLTGTEESTERSRSVNLFDLFNSSNKNLTQNLGTVEPDTSVLSDKSRDRSREQLFDDVEGEDGGLFGDEQPLADRDNEDSAPISGERTRTVGFATEPTNTDDVRSGRGDVRQPAEVKPAAVKPVEVKPVVVKQEEVKPAEPEKPKHVWKKYVRPSLDLLFDYPENGNVNTGEIEENKQIICETLANFRIDSRIANVVVGPAITRYDVIIEDRTNIKNALKYRDAIAMALMKENVNAYLNYAKGAISIEVPNAKRTVVGLKSMLASSEFLNAKPNSLTFTLGKNVDGQVVCPDITKMPHLLVAGTTGSGKSICLSTLIVSLLYKYGPEELRFILVDPKQVEFISYDKLPHLMINEIIYDIDKAMKALNWAIKEMERRYALFKTMTESGIATKNLTEYNAHLPEDEEKLPKIVIILDEFGDLMLQAKKEIESRIIRLVQKARACGIHLILATQRPSVDCITGLIKSNLPTRIGFKVNSFDDSRCIFDIGGAEKLLGKGDLYFRSAENPDLARIQGCFIDTPEVQKVTDFIKANNETYFDESVSDFINKVEEEQNDSPSSDDGAMGDSGAKVDDTFIKALWFCVTSNQASVSMIQRRFPIGYMKACKIIDWMENMNYITQSEGSKPRKVLLSRDEFIQKYGEVDD